MDVCCLSRYLYGQLFYAVAGVYLAERLNSLLGENWKSFSTQNYFDPNGVFLSSVWSGPLLVIAIIILVSKWICLFIWFLYLCLSDHFFAIGCFNMYSIFFHR